MEAMPAGCRCSRASLLSALRGVAEGLIAPAPAGGGLPAGRVVIFSGPTGAGKTTSIAKLAARLALRGKKKVVLMSLDGYRIGAVDQLRSYASLIGVPFRFVNDVSMLPAAVAEQDQKDFVLIDTAGRSPRDAASVEELVRVAEAVPGIERHLVLSATSKASDLDQIVERYERCRIDRLLFTKLDETSTLGPILNELVHAQKPISYYTDGQRVPEDLHVLPKERIIDFVLQES
jgi:flagellar biosynthesis protein FlhF